MEKIPMIQFEGDEKYFEVEFDKDDNKCCYINKECDYNIGIYYHEIEYSQTYVYFILNEETRNVEMYNDYHLISGSSFTLKDNEYINIEVNEGANSIFIRIKEYNEKYISLSDELFPIFDYDITNQNIVETELNIYLILDRYGNKINLYKGLYETIDEAVYHLKSVMDEFNNYDILNIISSLYNCKYAYLVYYNKLYVFENFTGNGIYIREIEKNAINNITYLDLAKEKFRIITMKDDNIKFIYHRGNLYYGYEKVELKYIDKKQLTEISDNSPLIKMKNLYNSLINLEKQIKVTENSVLDSVKNDIAKEIKNILYDETLFTKLSLSRNTDTTFVLEKGVIYTDTNPFVTINLEELQNIIKLMEEEY